MASELRASIVVQLSDLPATEASDAARICEAWMTFLEATKELPVESHLTIGPVLEAPVRRRRGRPRLAVTEPPAAA